VCINQCEHRVYPIGLSGQTHFPTAYAHELLTRPVLLPDNVALIFKKLTRKMLCKQPTNQFSYFKAFTMYTCKIQDHRKRKQTIAELD
jgi:hypothetical protein